MIYQFIEIISNLHHSKLIHNSPFFLLHLISYRGDGIDIGRLGRRFKSIIKQVKRGIKDLMGCVSRR